MIDIKKDLEETGLMVRKQGSVPANMPDSYITFWGDPSTDNLNVDNKTASVDYPFTVIYYTKDWENLYSRFEEIISLLKSKDYVMDGMGFDIESGLDEYSARCIEVTKIEKIGG